MSDKGLRTGELAERAGVKVQTLRYYERRGLLADPARRAVFLLLTLRGSGIGPGDDVSVRHHPIR